MILPAPQGGVILSKNILPASAPLRLLHYFSVYEFLRIPFSRVLDDPVHPVIRSKKTLPASAPCRFPHDVNQLFESWREWVEVTRRSQDSKKPSECIDCEGARVI